MATVSTTLPSFFSSDADFRTWGSTISAALATCGLVQTADTGQINWTTVTKPGATNTAAGYEIWRFADTLQSTTPVFIKVEYGTSGAVDRPSMWITVGSSSNGSGTIGGQAGSRRQVAPSASKTTGGTLPAYISGTSSRIVVAFNQDATSSTFPAIWQVARTLDATGANTADAVFVADQSSVVVPGRQTIPASGAVVGATQFTAWVAPFTQTPDSSTATPFSPAILFSNGKLLFGLALMHYNGADITAGAVVSVNMLGTTRTYLALGVNQGGSWTASLVANAGIAMLWE